MPSQNSQDKKPVLIIVAGPNGSGKTSLTEQIKKDMWAKNCIYINPDNIAKDKFGDWNSPDAVKKAVLHAETLRHDCLKKKKNFIFETVLSIDEKIKFIKKAKKNGYFIRLFFINTDSPIINARRVAQRVLEDGHDVPIAKIISRYIKSIANGIIAAKIVDRAYFYDNSIDNKPAKLVFRTKDGTIAREYCNSTDWIKEVRNAIKKQKKQKIR